MVFIQSSPKGVFVGWHHPLEPAYAFGPSLLFRQEFAFRHRAFRLPRARCAGLGRGESIYFAVAFAVMKRTKPKYFVWLRIVIVVRMDVFLSATSLTRLSCHRSVSDGVLNRLVGDIFLRIERLPSLVGFRIPTRPILVEFTQPIPITFSAFCHRSSVRRRKSARITPRAEGEGRHRGVCGDGRPSWRLLSGINGARRDLPIQHPSGQGKGAGGKRGGDARCATRRRSCRPKGDTADRIHLRMLAMMVATTNQTAAQNAQPARTGQFTPRRCNLVGGGK